jgi:hypothetical protein
MRVGNRDEQAIGLPELSSDNPISHKHLLAIRRLLSDSTDSADLTRPADVARNRQLPGSAAFGLRQSCWSKVPDVAPVSPTGPLVELPGPLLGPSVALELLLDDVSRRAANL